MSGLGPDARSLLAAASGGVPGGAINAIQPNA